MEDVIDAGINFQHPDLQQQVVADSASPEIPAEQTQTPANEATPTEASTAPPRKFAGKYTTVEEFERGYWNSAQEAKRLAEENKLLREIAASKQERVNPAERMDTRKKYLEELSEAAIPVDALANLIREEAQNIVRETFEPLARGAQARSQMLEKYADYEKAERDLNNFLSANPDVNEKYTRMMNAGLEDAALEYAYLNFSRSAAVPTDASGQEQAMARATAALAGNTVGSRQVSDSYLNRLQAARARFERDGDERALAAVALAGIHPDVPSG